MKNNSPLHDEYMLAVLIGALIFATGYFVRDFHNFSVTQSHEDGNMISSTLPPPPGDVPPLPPFTISANSEIIYNGQVGAVAESYEETDSGNADSDIYDDPWMYEE